MNCWQDDCLGVMRAAELAEATDEYPAGQPILQCNVCTHWVLSLHNHESAAELTERQREERITDEDRRARASAKQQLKRLVRGM